MSSQPQTFWAITATATFYLHKNDISDTLASVAQFKDTRGGGEANAKLDTFMFITMTQQLLKFMPPWVLSSWPLSWLKTDTTRPVIQWIPTVIVFYSSNANGEKLWILFIGISNFPTEKGRSTNEKAGLNCMYLHVTMVLIWWRYNYCSYSWPLQFHDPIVVNLYSWTIDLFL